MGGWAGGSTGFIRTPSPGLVCRPLEASSSSTVFFVTIGHLEDGFALGESDGRRKQCPGFAASCQRNGVPHPLWALVPTKMSVVNLAVVFRLNFLRTESRGSKFHTFLIPPLPRYSRVVEGWRVERQRAACRPLWGRCTDLGPEAAIRYVQVLADPRGAAPVPVVRAGPAHGPGRGQRGALHLHHGQLLERQEQHAAHARDGEPRVQDEAGPAHGPRHAGLPRWVGGGARGGARAGPPTTVARPFQSSSA